MKLTALPFIHASCRRLLTLLLMLVLQAGCGDDHGFVKVGKGKGIGTGGEQDAAVEAGTTMPKDASTSALPDGAVMLADGAVVFPEDGEDGGADPNAFDPADCKLSEDQTFEVAVPFPDEGGFSLAPGATGFGLAFMSDGATAKAISTARIESTGPFPEPISILDEGKVVTDVALLGTSEGYRVAWVDNFTQSAELHTMLLDDALELGAASKRQTITNNTLTEQRPVLANVAGKPLLAWIARDPLTYARRIASQRLDGASSIVNLLDEGMDHAPVKLALAQVGESKAVVAWIEEVASRGAWLRKLDETGKPVGDPLRISDLVSAGSTIDLGTREEDGGAAIYSVVVQEVSREVRFRRLDENGDFAGSEIKIVSRPLQAKDASLVRIGGGYAVAYRALPVSGSEITTPEIRVTFISKEGNVTRDAGGRLVSYLVAPAAHDGGRITARLSVDGQLLFAFVDGELAQGKTLRLVRRRLDCP